MDGNVYKLSISNGTEFEQAVCTDAVSRQEVLDIINAYDIPPVIRLKVKCLQRVQPVSLKGNEK